MENTAGQRVIFFPKTLDVTVLPGRRAGRRFPRHLLLGGALLALVAALALLAPLLAPVAPDVVRPSLRLLPPAPGHLFGTDPFGRDLFSQVLYGARLALEMTVFSVLLSALPGMSLGLLAGYHGGRLDQLVSRAMDAWLAFPSMLLAIVLVARLGPSLITAAVAVGIVGIPSFYRVLRSGSLSARNAPYIEAARASGAGDERILLRHVLPNLSSSIIVITTLRLGTVLLVAGGLSFLGLGAQPPQPEWGALLATGRRYMDSAWWLAVFPGLAITITVMGFNLLGDGLRDVLAREN